MNRFLRLATFAAGLAVVGWIAAGYLGTSLLALAVTMLIAAFFLMGALELRRFEQATAGLAQALAEMPAPLPELRPWLDRVPTALQPAVRRRIDGESAGLPGPAMAPYLAGLLVLLGMLGTFLGMVLTLRGTGSALAGAADLAAVRDSLAAPVQGLGLAFGTSVAGVAASAALGLMSALGRRERVQVAQLLDKQIADSLHVFSKARARDIERDSHREQTLALLQRQTEQMPALVEQLQTMMATLARQAEQANTQLLASQERFQVQAGTAYAGLAASVDKTLKDSLTASARAAGDTIQPVVEATLAGIARETRALHATLAGSLQQQLDQLSARFEASSSRVADTWQAALGQHERSSQGLSEALGASLTRFTDTFEQRSASLLDTVGQHQAASQQALAAAMAELARDSSAWQERLASTATGQISSVTARLDDTAQRVTDGWQAALAQHQQASEQAAHRTQQALSTAAASFEQHAASLLRTASQAHDQLQSASATQDQQRLAAMTQALEQMAASLRAEWQAAGAQTLAQQARICETMERTAREITTQAETHAASTIAEIGQLMQAAAEAPRAAAEVIGELRQQLSDSMARDNALLEERAQVLETLGTLLTAVNQAATEQRGAIDALVEQSAGMLARVGEQFGAQVETQSAQLTEAAAQLTGSAAEVGSLGEAFGTGVQLFSDSNEKLVSQLQRIEGALSKSLSRSDEQLAYYVAQAREVIDLSMLSQKQIIEELQRVSGNLASAEAA